MNDIGSIVLGLNLRGWSQIAEEAEIAQVYKHKDFKMLGFLMASFRQE